MTQAERVHTVLLPWACTVLTSINFEVNFPMEAWPKNHSGVNFGKWRVMWKTTEIVPRQSEDATPASVWLVQLTPRGVYRVQSVKQIK